MRSVFQFCFWDKKNDSFCCGLFIVYAKPPQKVKTMFIWNKSDLRPHKGDEVMPRIEIEWSHSYFEKWFCGIFERMLEQ